MGLPSLLPALLDSVCLYSGEILAQISSGLFLSFVFLLVPVGPSLLKWDWLGGHNVPIV